MKDQNENKNPSQGPNQGDDLKNNPNYSTPSDPADIRDSVAEDGSTDGVARKTAGSGSDTGGEGGRIGGNTGSDNNEGQLGGGESRDRDKRSPSVQGEQDAHTTKGQGGSAGGGDGGREGSMSGGSSS